MEESSLDGSFPEESSLEGSSLEGSLVDGSFLKGFGVGRLCWRGGAILEEGGGVCDEEGEWFAVPAVRFGMECVQLSLEWNLLKLCRVASTACVPCWRFSCLSSG